MKGYDYSHNGAYFVTLCTHERRMLFGDVGADSISARTTDPVASQMIDETFLKTIKRYPNAHCPKYVIMPNHIHAIIVLDHEDAEPDHTDTERTDMESERDTGRADMESAPTTLSEIIQSFKRYSTVEYIKLVKRGAVPPFDKQIWQRSYYDHIIRNEQEYQQIWEYIDSNPLKWDEDCYR